MTLFPIAVTATWLPCWPLYYIYDLLDYITRHDQGYWLFRGPAQATVPAVEQFVQSGREQALITLQPPQGEALTAMLLT